MRRGRAGILLLPLLGACGAQGSGVRARYQDFNPGKAPAEYHQGEMIFNTYCMSCHGLYGRGEGLGPALLDTLYRPDRLTDDAVLAAVERGVSQHNFHFGAMPPVKRITPAEAQLVLGYVRWLQRGFGGVRGGQADSLGGH
jgi:mono/diheme cytochrome c family protein